MRTRSIRINGIVQGVGFRPFVARLARELGICGSVCNSTHGVEIQAFGTPEMLEGFLRRLESDAPVAAVIVSVEASPVEEASSAEMPADFSIVASAADTSRDTLVSPDLATCPDCLRELFDPTDRRYHYPFINCTNCGPRFTIIDDLPYDRPVTSMRSFAMCPTCAAEYSCESDRRYHAQPDACFDCGPALWWSDGESAGTPAQSLEESDALIAKAAQELQAGSVLAVKGLGGWHLCCDATNPEAVATLRERKHRPTKPLAVMVHSLEQAKHLCKVSDTEAKVLESPARPIVLMLLNGEARVAGNVAGSLPELGLMLPSTPVQHLLCRAAQVPLVMTSGNRSGEPIVAADGDAFDALGQIADGFLGNNRAIVARYDDSVVRVLAGKGVQMVRRARGYAPAPLFLKESAPKAASASEAAAADTAKPPVILACGPQQKATFCLLNGERAYLSQHLGDLESLGSWNAWEEARDRYQRLFGMEPVVLACDLHPEYLSSKWARKAAAQRAIPLVEVQHHHAHIASVLGENALEEPVLGVAVDGTGYGTDGTIWGCELLLATRKDFKRLWHLPSFALPGGAAAVRDPRRTAFALLHEAGLLEDPRFQPFVSNVPGGTLMRQMIERGINSPRCSSAGRIFDAVSALLGLCQTAGYDGEPACLLEAAAQAEPVVEKPFTALEEESPALLAKLLAEPLTARGFHHRLAGTIIERCRQARQQTGIQRVALSGGCMVNRLLRKLLVEGLASEGFVVYENRELPPNDGCISYGQAIVAQARLQGE